MWDADGCINSFDKSPVTFNLCIIVVILVLYPMRLHRQSGAKFKLKIDVKLIRNRGIVGLQDVTTHAV